jgi:methylenetetrahydrofolate dehydrogenase (NADP+)/methenyltetrahydrofolate cyclohydrolase
MAVLIDGKATSAKIRGGLAEKTIEFKKKYGYAPGLAVVIVGDDPASKIYVRNKKKACDEIGYNSFEYALPAETTEAELLSLIDKLNEDKAVHGILVQSPVPSHIDEKKIQAAILPQKDVDAFHPVNVGKIMIGDYDFVPCTPAGITELLDEYGIETCGKSCTVIGRSNIVGKPMAMLMLHKNSTVTICHSKTPDVGAVTRNADIVIAAVGKAGFLTGDMIKDGAVVIDVGMNRDAAGKLCGDADFASCEKKASYITPVPGGVGPMTITMLMKNTLKAAELFAEGE